MKKISVMMVVCFCFGNATIAQSIDPVSLILAKAIKAVDIKVQKLQNETLVMQRLQLVAEQSLAKSKLEEITGWQKQLTDLYAGYFTELHSVKSSIAGGSVVRKILALQRDVVIEYGRLGKDASLRVSFDELLASSMEILETLQMVVGSQFSMKDAERVMMLYTLKDAMGHCLEGMQKLNRRQTELIQKQVRIKAELDYVKRLHGIK